MEVVHPWHDRRPVVHLHPDHVPGRLDVEADVASRVQHGIGHDLGDQQDERLDVGSAVARRPARELPGHRDAVRRRRQLEGAHRRETIAPTPPEPSSKRPRRACVRTIDTWPGGVQDPPADGPPSLARAASRAALAWARRRRRSSRSRASASSGVGAPRRAVPATTRPAPPAPAGRGRSPAPRAASSPSPRAGRPWPRPGLRARSAVTGSPTAIVIGTRVRPSRFGWSLVHTRCDPQITVGNSGRAGLGGHPHRPCLEVLQLERAADGGLGEDTDDLAGPHRVDCAAGRNRPRRPGRPGCGAFRASAAR